MDARTELGTNDGPMEDELADAFGRIVSEGAQRLHRTWREVLTTGLAGGLEVATGVVALLAVYAATGSHLLAGLAFSIGFLALLLARSELFTEGFLGARHRGGRQTGQGGLSSLKLWSGHAGGQPGRRLAGHVAGDARATRSCGRHDRRVGHRTSSTPPFACESVCARPCSPGASSR